MQQPSEVRGFRSFKSLDSAAETISKIASGKAQRPQRWTMVAVSESLVEWAKWQGAIETMATNDDMPLDQISTEALTMGPRLVIDLARLASKLAEFGIELEVR
jgi:hypothetical protein